MLSKTALALFLAALFGGSLGWQTSKTDATHYYEGYDWDDPYVVWCLVSSMSGTVENNWSWSTTVWSNPSD
jgi:hypothetical protein